MSIRSIDTPCVGRCSTVFGDRTCRGCKRFHHEIVNWNLYSAEQKEAVWRRLDALLDQVMASKVEVFDPQRLRARLDELSMRYRPQRPETCLAYQLIARGPRAVGSLEACGLRLKAPHQHQSLRELRDLIDLQYFAISDAYQERFLTVENL